MKPVAFKTKRSSPARMPYTESRVGAPRAFSNDGRGRHAWPPAIQKMSRQNVTELDPLFVQTDDRDEMAEWAGRSTHALGVSGCRLPGRRARQHLDAAYAADHHSGCHPQEQAVFDDADRLVELTL